MEKKSSTANNWRSFLKIEKEMLSCIVFQECLIESSRLSIIKSAGSIYIYCDGLSIYIQRMVKSSIPEIRIEEFTNLLICFTRLTKF